MKWEEDTEMSYAYANTHRHPHVPRHGKGLQISQISLVSALTQKESQLTEMRSSIMNIA